MTLQINSLVDELSALPEQDSASMRLLALTNDPDSESRDIAAVIESDPSMSTRILTLANSAFFSVRTPATNAWAGVMVIGFNVVRALAATGSLGLNRDGEMPKGFFDHSMASAAGASVIAKRSGMRASDAFSAGLLHDVGGALLFHAHRSQWHETAKTTKTGQQSVLTAEQRVFGAGHDEIGAAVLEALMFPSSIVDVVRRHNEPVDQIEDDLTRAVVGGIALAELSGTASTTEPIGQPEQALATLGVGEAETDDLIAELRNELAELEAILR